MSANLSDIAFSVIIKNDGIDDIVFKTIMLKGEKGNSVARVEKTSTSGLVDTYTIYLTDGTAGGTFNVTNGNDINIDDTAVSYSKTWSSQKIKTELDALESETSDAIDALSDMIPKTGTIEDVTMASFSDGADDVPLSELTVDIEAVQDGSGVPSPSNVRAISGWEECKVTKCSKNLLPLKNGSYLVNGVTIVIENGQITANGLASSGGGRLTPLSDIFTLKAGRYYINGNIAVSGLTPYINNAKDNSAINTGDARSFVLEKDARVFLGINVTNGQTYSNATGFPMLNIGTTAFPYEAYNGGTDTIELTETVYGGTLNVSTGLMTVTHAKSPFSAIANANGWNRTGAGVFYIYPLNNALPNCKYPFANHPISTHFEYQVSGTLEDGCFRCSDALYFNKNDETDIASCKAWLSTTDGCFIYELSEPQTIQLTPTEVRTLLNANNIYADTGNVEKIVYFKTGSEAVAKLIEAYMRESE